MPVVKCPSCGQRGATEPGSETFDALGEWEGQAAFKCHRCGSAMALRQGRFGWKAIRIDAADVSELEPERQWSIR
jgi:predicted RNA-binding Zn-ribbon protein involved in translation (DUF1610 family)